MMHEEEKQWLKQEEKVVVLGLLLGMAIGVVVGTILNIFILGFASFSILGVFIGSTVNLISRNKKISG